MSIENLLSRLKTAKKTGTDRWMARCPAHDDRTSSLSIKSIEDGKILCHCHAGCNIEQVLNSIGLRVCDLFKNRLADSKGQRPHLLATEALSIISHEAMVVAMCGSRLMEGLLTDADRNRLFLAVSRINEALRKTGVHRG